MKRFATLILALLAIIMITRIENYLSQSGAEVLDTKNRQIDSYLADFTLRAIRDDGLDDYTMSGHHLSHWNAEGQSLIIKPRLQTTAGYEIVTDQLYFDQRTQEIFTESEVFITSPSGTMQSTGLQGKLNENILKFNANVRSTYQIN